MKKAVYNLAILFSLFLLTSNLVVAAPIVRQGSGANAAGIQGLVDQFRADLGGANNGVGGSFRTGRREINWDGVPNQFSSPNLFPPNFFNVNSPRGVLFFNDSNSATPDSFQVSANAASGTPVEFGNIDPSYTANFQTFSAERLFATIGSTMTEIDFFVPGTKIPATVSGFGAVFTDVNSRSNTFIKMYAAGGTKITAISVPAINGGLSFLGVSFNGGERIAKVVIQTGNAPLSAGNVDGVNNADVVARDDFIYGEPRAADFHTGDFDGDGITDSNIFRPAAGQWFTLNSGSNTVSIVQWGQNGDIPVDGDFDGDQIADQAIFRPSDGTWWINRSSNGQAIVTQFGANGDKPVAGDYDKDGKTDIAVWRPSNGNFFIARSSTNFSTFFGYGFGQNGDIPVQGAAQ